MSITNKPKSDTIFISIASYRDNDLISTVLDCINKADNPNKLFFGICLQDEKSKFDLLRAIRRKYKANMRIAFFDWRDSQGACWARYLIQKKLFKGQTFYLQLDSHHRFIEQWDSVLVDMFYKKQAEGIEKPIIGGYCPGFQRTSNNCDDGIIQIISFDTFTSDGDLVFRPYSITKKIDSVTLPARYLSGHFIFTTGMFCTDCLYDPNLYFRGEEISLSARAFTSGYDFYHPNFPIIWHYYIRSDEEKHWNNHQNGNGFIISTTIREKKAKERVRKLLGSEKNDINFGTYGLGSNRSLHEYELYAGLDFKKKRVHAYSTNTRGDAPFPYTMTEEEWDKSMLLNKLVSVDIDPEITKHINQEIESLVLFLENHKGDVLFRADIKHEEIPILLRNDLQWKKTIGIEDLPTKAFILPYYKTKKFGPRLEKSKINYYDTK